MLLKFTFYILNCCTVAANTWSDGGAQTIMMRDGSFRLLDLTTKNELKEVLEPDYASIYSSKQCTKTSWVDFSEEAIVAKSLISTSQLPEKMKTGLLESLPPLIENSLFVDFNPVYWVPVKSEVRDSKRIDVSKQIPVAFFGFDDIGYFSKEKNVTLLVFKPVFEKLTLSDRVALLIHEGLRMYRRTHHLNENIGLKDIENLTAQIVRGTAISFEIPDTRHLYFEKLERFKKLTELAIDQLTTNEVKNFWFVEDPPKSLRDFHWWILGRYFERIHGIKGYNKLAQDIVDDLWSLNENISTREEIRRQTFKTIRLLFKRLKQARNVDTKTNDKLHSEFVEVFKHLTDFTKASILHPSALIETYGFMYAATTNPSSGIKESEVYGPVRTFIKKFGQIKPTLIDDFRLKLRPERGKPRKLCIR